MAFSFSICMSLSSSSAFSCGCRFTSPTEKDPLIHRQFGLLKQAHYAHKRQKKRGTKRTANAMSSTNTAAAEVRAPTDEVQHPPTESAPAPRADAQKEGKRTAAASGAVSAAEKPATSKSGAETKHASEAPPRQKQEAIVPTGEPAAATPNCSPAMPATAMTEHKKRVAFTHPASASARSVPPSQQQPSPSSSSSQACHTTSASVGTSRPVLSASPQRVDLSPPGSLAAGPGHAANTDATDAYTCAEAERIAAAAAALTPNTVLCLFRRGGDNSHTNRMEVGSYSRYLLSTDHMPAMVLSETFHGEQPTLGTAPRNTVKPRVEETEDVEAEAEAEAEASAERPPNGTQGNAESRPRFSSSSMTNAAAAAAAAPVTASAEAAQMSATRNSTAGSGTLKREVVMLDAATFAGLDKVRQRRRHDPSKGQPDQPQLDYVYYNHKSKGYYVPHDPSPETVMLEYNHMYSFGDGTRFAPLTTSPTHSQQQQREAEADGRGTYRCNPHAAPPRTFAESRGCVFALTASQRQQPRSKSSSSQHSAIYAPKRVSEAGAAQQQRRQRRTDIRNGTRSLRTAKAIDLDRLHRTQCPRPRTIEEVLADQHRNYLYSGGAPQPLVQDIRRDVSSGKLNWEEVPASLQTALTAAATSKRTAFATSQKNDISSRSSSNHQQQAKLRTASLSQPLNGLVDVMGHLRPVPAIVAAMATRSTNSTSAAAQETAVEEQPCSTFEGLHNGSNKSGKSGAAMAPAALQQLPAISR